MTGLELAIPLPQLPPVYQGYRHVAPGQAFPAILTWCQLRLLLSLILVIRLWVSQSPAPF